MCEKPNTGDYTHLEPIRTKALKKYVFAVEEVV